ncbi:hepatic lectin-like [Pelobates fuscus]|uniref:hepatic lectin-like n=1 Tax=Pelobates fuscus TaxID=191477 RepID=UPI002FE47B80
MDLEISENEYQNMETLHYKKKSKMLADSGKYPPSQPRATKQSFRVLYGLVAICAGLLLMTALLSVLVTYRELKQMDQKLESMFINLNVSMNSQMEHNSQENRLQLEAFNSTSERLSVWAFKQSIKFLDPICEQGWSYSQLSCYKFFKDKKSWTDSKAFCESKNSHLVVINNQAEQDYVPAFAANMVAWIGLTEVDGDWKWVDGTKYNLTQTHWSVGQPDNWFDPEKKEHEDCALLLTSGKWNDLHWSYPNSFICEKEI